MVRGTPDDIGDLAECVARRRAADEVRLASANEPLCLAEASQRGRLYGYRGRLAPDEGLRWVPVSSAGTFSGHSVVKLLVLTVASGGWDGRKRGAATVKHYIRATLKSGQVCGAR